MLEKIAQKLHHVGATYESLDLLDTREMQRLRRVRQLGTAFLVYPGANHTRFEHAHRLYVRLGFRPDGERTLAGDINHTLEYRFERDV